MIFLIDHNIEGQATWLWGTILAEGWLEWKKEVIEKGVLHV